VDALRRSNHQAVTGNHTIFPNFVSPSSDLFYLDTEPSILNSNDSNPCSYISISGQVEFLEIGLRKCQFFAVVQQKRGAAPYWRMYQTDQRSQGRD
jgi:hypothetical protein